jgi:nicotinamidase-related amidase
MAVFEVVAAHQAHLMKRNTSMKIALLLIDIQNDYFTGGKMALEGTGQASENAAALLAAFRRLQLPVIHIQHVAKRAGATFFLPDTEGVKIHTSVAPLGNESVIQKNYPNSFRQTALLDYLKEHQISKLVIAGMMTHMCIDTTTRAACDLEFTVQLAHDACATKALSFGGVEIPASHVHNAYIAALDGSFAEALSTQHIIAGFAPK